MTNKLAAINAEYTDYKKAEDCGELSLDELVQEKRETADNEKVRLSFLKNCAVTSEDSFMILIHCLVVLLAELTAGVVYLKDCMGISRKPKFNDFATFLQIMEVYGSGYQDDVDY
jgi:hypothetical protein